MICRTCGTRNPDEQSHCRRCKNELIPIADGPTTLHGRWRIESLLPNGYGGQLAIGRDSTTGRSVLIKRLDAIAARDRAARSRFLKEAALLRDLDHDHVVRVLDVVEDGETPALVMAYPTGEPLRDLLNRLETLPMTVALTFALQLADALDYVHSAGVTHRNLRPGSIFVGPNPQTGLPHLTLVDFGLAGAPEAQTGGTLLGMRPDSTLTVIPSPYVAPELFSETSDARADIYSLGVILFEMLTGRPPVAAGVTDADALVEAIKNEPPTHLRLLRPEAPAPLADVVARMVAKNLDDRYFDIAQTRLALMSAELDPMVAVPRGPFLRGSREHDMSARPEEQPMRELDLSAFYIDRNPVTVAQFAHFLQITNLEPPADWSRHNTLPNHPVVNITWEEATAYAAWAGKRLPTEAEWEKAARGTDGRTYPWGNEPPDETRAHFDGAGTKGHKTAAINSHPAGASPYGAQEMAGNTFEWVNDWYSRTYFAECPDTDPPGPTEGHKRVLRGGSFVHEAFALRCATRGRYAPDERRANHSFRCAWSLE